MDEREYTCAYCDKVFISDWSDEEALAEMRINFGDLSEQDREVVCDDCYKKLMEAKHQE